MSAVEEATVLEAARSPSARERDAAYRAIYQALREPVLALCLHLTHDLADAEDAVQDVFLSVHRALGTFRSQARLSTWVFRIAIRAALSRRAKSKRHPGDVLNEDLADPGLTPEAATEARLRSERMLRALSALSAEHQTVLSLFALHGLSHKEIAEILGIKEGTVWSRLHLARRQLQKLLEDRPD